MSKLADLEQLVSAILSSQAGIEEKAPQIRDAMKDMLADPAFVFSCIDQALTHFEQNPDLRPQPPLFVSQDRQFAAHLIYWPPKQKNSPHMHSTWGSTGVFFNEIVTDTFNNDGDLANPQLSLDNRFVGQRGETGYLLPRCIHCVSNETDRPSASLHLFGTDDENQPASCSTVWFGDDIGMPGDPKIRAMAMFAEILLDMPGEEADQMLARVFELANNQTQLRIVKGVSARNLALGYRLSVALEQQLEGVDRARLSAINQKLSQKLEAIE